MTKVSVIVPVYNVEKYLRECLDSLINQTLTDIEIICTDDCSTDGSLNILNEYSQKDSRIKILKQTVNKGAGAARNMGLDIAQGEYIMFLDPDDWYELDACECAYNQIATYKNDFAIFAHNRYYENTQRSQYVDSMLNPFKCHKEEHNIKLAELNTNFIEITYSTCLIYNRNFLNTNNIRFPDYRIFEDQYFYIKTMLMADNASVIGRALYNYRIQKKSSTFVYRNQHDNILMAKSDILKMTEQLAKSESVKKAVFFHTIKSCFHWFNIYSKINKSTEEQFYNNIKKIFQSMDKKYIENHIDKKIARRYNTVLKYDYSTYKLLQFIKTFMKILFNLSNVTDENGKRKILTILGLKVKVKTY